MIRRFAGITLLTLEHLTELRLATLDRHDPRPVDPWRIVTDVLEMTAAQLGDPVIAFINVITGNRLLHL